MLDLEGEKSKFNHLFSLFHVHECPEMPVMLKGERENSHRKNVNLPVYNSSLLWSEMWKRLLDGYGCFRIFSGSFSHSKIFFFFSEKVCLWERFSLFFFFFVNCDVFLSLLKKINKSNFFLTTNFLFIKLNPL